MLPILPALLAILMGGFGDANRVSVPSAQQHFALAVIAQYWAESVVVTESSEAAPVVRQPSRNSRPAILTVPEYVVGPIPAGFAVGSRTRDGP
jgi:hypothetical protein